MSADPELTALMAAGRRRMDELDLSVPERWLLVDVTGQRLALIRQGAVALVKPVSTAAAGIDCRQDSGGTPGGLHVIGEKIGDGMAPGTVFRGRRPTGEIWPADVSSGDEEDLILTRILTLDGCEEGRNRGPDVDSRARYIYLHGTNDEGRIGRPVSHGCVRLTSADIVEIFAQVEAGDPVFIG